MGYHWCSFITEIKVGTVPAPFVFIIIRTVLKPYIDLDATNIAFRDEFVYSEPSYMLNRYFGMNRLISNDVDTCLVQGSRRSSTPMSMDDSIHTEASRDSDVCYSLNVLPFRVADEVHPSPEVELPLGRCD